MINKKWYKNILLPFLLIPISIACSGCFLSAPLPDSSDAVSFLHKHENELKEVVEYLRGLDCKTYYIRSADGSALADLEHVRIEEGAVVESVKALFGDGCIDIYMSTERNSIQFVLWTRTRGEVDCGLLYALDPGDPPEAQYMTGLVPLEEDPWYFYRAEYNKWRVQQTTVAGLSS